jgi:hypothetical protein
MAGDLGNVFTQHALDSLSCELINNQQSQASALLLHSGYSAWSGGNELEILRTLLAFWADAATKPARAIQRIRTLRGCKFIPTRKVVRFKPSQFGAHTRATNDPSSATRPTGRVCNRDAHVGFAAAIRRLRS